MAKVKNIIGKSLQGQIGKELVFKRYGRKTIVTKFPDMGGVKPSPLQTLKRQRFAEAVAYARAINNDPLQKSVYKKKVPKGRSVYHYALQEYLKRLRP